MNTGEGGLSPYHMEGGCDVIYQIGTAKYGVRDEQGNLSDEKLRSVSKHVKAFGGLSKRQRQRLRGPLGTPDLGVHCRRLGHGLPVQICGRPDFSP